MKTDDNAALPISVTEDAPQLNPERWLREVDGTFELLGTGRKQKKRKICSHGVSISTILFVIREATTDIRYRLRFRTSNGDIETLVNHDDLADEQSFLKVAPAGFAMSSATKAFAILRECLMEDLETAGCEAIVTCLGWHLFNGKPIYVHAAGVICSDDDSTEKVELEVIGTTELNGLIDINQRCSDVPILCGRRRPVSKVYFQGAPQLMRYRFPEVKSKEEAQAAVRSLLQLIDLGEPSIIYIALASSFLSAIDDVRFALFLYGDTGSMKTAFGLLLQSFFIPGASESDCVIMKSTENALRARMTSTGNVSVLFDDYVQLTSSRHGGEEARKADNVFRTIVNGAAKDRCSGDGALRSKDRPRGMAIITGEQLPDGLDSLVHRMVTLPFEASTFQKSTYNGRPNDFDSSQEKAKTGVYAQAMGAFVSYLSKNLNHHREFVRNMDHGLVKKNIPVHGRLADAVNTLASAMTCFLGFARTLGVCDEEEFEDHSHGVGDALEKLVTRSYLEQLENTPVESFGLAIQAALASRRCHIEVRNMEDHLNDPKSIPLDLIGYSECREVVRSVSNEASDSSACVEPESSTVSNSSDSYEESETITTYKPHGTRIGWIDWMRIDLIPIEALSIANSMLSRSGGQSLPNRKQLGKLLASTGWTRTHSSGRNTYKIRVDRVLFDVWSIDAYCLFEPMLDWGDFDVGSYQELTTLEQKQLHLKELDRRRELIRTKIRNYQSTILNPYLTPEDRDLIRGITSASKGVPVRETSEVSGNTKIVPETYSHDYFPGYSDPEEFFAP